jgi:hypothetical protein
MTRDELLQLIAEVQQHQSELDDVEVKSAQRGTPQQLIEEEFLQLMFDAQDV